MEKALLVLVRGVVTVLLIVCSCGLIFFFEGDLHILEKVWGEDDE